MSDARYLLLLAVLMTILSDTASIRAEQTRMRNERTEAEGKQVSARRVFEVLASTVEACLLFVIAIALALAALNEWKDWWT